MKEKSSNLASRQELILQMLHSAGSVTIEGLCSTLEASVATVRRDLQDLEERALLRRTRGGAVTMGPLFYEPFRHDSSFQDKVGSFADEKRRIARAAAGFVNEGDTVALSGGTTTTEVVRGFMSMRRITVITNTVNVAMELSTCKDIEVIVTGGMLRGNWFTMVGPLANMAANMVYADVMFLGVDGIRADFGLSCQNPQEAEYLRLDGTAREAQDRRHRSQQDRCAEQVDAVSNDGESARSSRTLAQVMKASRRLSRWGSRSSASELPVPASFARRP